MIPREIVGPQDRFERTGAQALRDVRPITTRLKDAEGADIGDELVVGVIAGHGLAGICRIRLEDLGVERA